MLNKEEIKNIILEKIKKDSIDRKSPDYKIVISELGISPFRMMRGAFALMGVIPLLILAYIIVGEDFFNNLFLGNNAFAASFAVVISLVGFVYSYSLVEKMIKKLLEYSYERKRAEDEKMNLLLTVSHDVKAPLSVVKVGISNLLDGIGGALSKIHMHIAEACLNAVNKIAHFIGEILEFSKVCFARSNFKRKLVDLEKVVQKELEGIRELAKKNSQTLRYVSQAKDLNFWADEDKIGRVIMNLLSNAIKYTPEGGRIDVVLAADKNVVKLAVINTGPGILPEELGKLFNRYERLAKHLGTEGTGIGLTIVKDIVDLHQGRITVRSEPNKETEFGVILPRDLRAKRRV